MALTGIHDGSHDWMDLRVFSPMKLGMMIRKARNDMATIDQTFHG